MYTAPLVFLQLMQSVGIVSVRCRSISEWAVDLRQMAMGRSLGREMVTSPQRQPPLISDMLSFERTQEKLGLGDYW